MADQKKEKLDTQWALQFMVDEFKKESDRAAVILVASVLDEKISTLLKSRLIAAPTADDSFFDGANAPLSTFSSKIDAAFRFGLISTRFCRDLHLIRRIRNAFAHDIYGCNFDNGGIKSRVVELYKACTMSEWHEVLLQYDYKNVEGGTRGAFLFVASLMVIQLDAMINNMKPMEQLSGVSSEVMYRDPKAYIEEVRKKEQG